VSHAAHRALADVYARHPEHKGGHGLGSGGARRGRRREEGPTARELGGVPAVGEEAEVADPDEAAREHVGKLASAG
jgi:hypothetical protein